MHFATVVKRIGDRLAEDGEPFALVGGLGLAAHGIARATLDLDLLVPARAQDALIAFMEDLGYETLHRSSGYSNHLHPDETLGRVDFIYVRGATEKKLFAGARKLEGPQGVQILVPKPEHLAAMKILAMKNDPTRRLQELADISRLLDIEGVDSDEIRAAFKQHGMLGSWHEIERDRAPERDRD